MFCFQLIMRVKGLGMVSFILLVSFISIILSYKFYLNEGCKANIFYFKGRSGASE